MALAFAATAGRPAALLTGAVAAAGTPDRLIGLLRPAATRDMVRAGPDRHALSATAALVRDGDLPGPLPQILFQTADAVTPGARGNRLIGRSCWPRAAGSALTDVEPAGKGNP